MGLAVEGLERELVRVGDAAARVDGGEVVLREAAVIAALLAPGGQYAVRDEAAVVVVVVAVAVVAVQHRELGAVDRAQLVRGQTQRQRHQGVDLQQRLTAVLRPAQRRLRRPLRADVAQVHPARPLRQARPRVVAERPAVALRPHVALGVSDAAQSEHPQQYFGFARPARRPAHAL